MFQNEIGQGLYSLIESIIEFCARFMFSLFTLTRYSRSFCLSAKRISMWNIQRVCTRWTRQRVTADSDPQEYLRRPICYLKENKTELRLFFILFFLLFVYVRVCIICGEERGGPRVWEICFCFHFFFSFLFLFFFFLSCIFRRYRGYSKFICQRVSPEFNAQ